MILTSDGHPLVDASARTLGVRPRIDVPGDATDYVDPGAGGMSVAIGTAAKLPDHRRPVVFGGSGTDPAFAMEEADLGPRLMLRVDSDGPSGHGFVEPVRRMIFDEYQDAIWATVAKWWLVES